MSKQIIEIEGLPEGWEPVAFGWPNKNTDYVFDGIGVKLFTGKEEYPLIVVKKKQPRRIVLEEKAEVKLKSMPIGLYDYDPSSPNGYD